MAIELTLIQISLIQLNILLVPQDLIYKANGSFSNFPNQNLNAMIVFATFLGPDTFDIKSKQQIIAFLDTRIRNSDIDPDKRWITTWNDYLWRINYFLEVAPYNHKDREQKGMEPRQQPDWAIPPFANIRKEIQAYKPIFGKRIMGT